MPDKPRFMYHMILFILLTFTFSHPLFASSLPLPPEQAFGFKLKDNTPPVLIADWQMAPGYYLYRDKLTITFTPTYAAKMAYPQGDLKQDANRGRYEVYQGHLRIPIYLPAGAHPEKITISYQGCSMHGFCYPPTTHELKLKNSTPAATAPLLTDQNGINLFLQRQHVSMIFLLFAGLGLLLAFTPCVLPMIPILTSIIVGQKKTINTRKAFLLSLSYVLGSAIMFSIAGVIAALMGNSLQVWLQQPWIIGLVSVLFVFLALSLFDLYDLALPQGWQTKLTLISNKQQGGCYLGVFFMGMLSTLIVSPCVTAPLIGVLLYIAQTGDVWLGASSLFVMAIAMGIPLIIIGSSAGKWLPKRGPWMMLTKKICGLLMLAMAIWLCSRILMPVAIALLWSIFFFALVLFCLGYVWRSLKTKNKLLAFSMSLLIGIAGVILILLINGPVFLHKNAMTVSNDTFTKIQDVTAAQKWLSRAKETAQPVIIDFYAAWCASCVAMDKEVFAHSEVKQALKAAHYLLLRVDLSAYNKNDQALMAYFGVIAPPAVLFFDAAGQALQAKRIDGEVNANLFLARLAG